MKPHLKLDKLDVIDAAKEIWNTIDHSKENNNDISFYRQASKTMGHYSLGKVTKRWDYFREYFKPLTDENCLIEFYVGDPFNYLSSPHTDRGRTVAMNIPIEVDYEKSNAYFGKYFGLENYPTYEGDEDFSYTFNLARKETDYKQETNPRYRGEYIPEFYDDVIIDSVVLFDPACPHGGWNKATTQRVLMSLSFDSLSYAEAHERCIELGWTSAIS